MSEEQEMQPVQVSPESDNSQPKPAKKRNTKVLWLGLVVALVLGLLGLGGVAAYGVYNVSESPTIVSLATVFRIPVAKVNGDKVLYRDYIADLKSLRTFYSAQPGGVPYNTEEQSDQVLSRLIANTLVAQAADKMNVEVTKEEREAARADVLSRFDNDEAKLEADLKSNLGLSLNEFMERILEPTILEKKMAEQFATSTDDTYKAYDEEQVRASHILFQVATAADDAKVKAEANKVLAEIKAGANFAEKAKQYGSDGTKDTGGDLGWFGRGAMVKEFEDAAFALKPGELKPELVKTEFGYHIIRTEEKRAARNFTLYMNDQLKAAKIEVFGQVHNPFENLVSGEQK